MEKINDLYGEFKEIETSTHFTNSEKGDTPFILKKYGNETRSLWKSKFVSNSIFFGAFFIWSLILVIIFYPRFITKDDKFSFKWYMIVSLLTFLSLIALYYLIQFIQKRFLCFNK